MLKKGALLVVTGLVVISGIIKGASLKKSGNLISLYISNLKRIGSVEGLNINEYRKIKNYLSNSMKLEPECLNKLDQKFLKTSFIYIFQTTKEGIFKGQQEFEHLVDTVIKTEITDNLHGKAFTEKNRFGGKGEFGVF